MFICLSLLSWSTSHYWFSTDPTLKTHKVRVPTWFSYMKIYYYSHVKFKLLYMVCPIVYATFNQRWVDDELTSSRRWFSVDPPLNMQEVWLTFTCYSMTWPYHCSCVKVSVRYKKYPKGHVTLNHWINVRSALALHFEIESTLIRCFSNIENVQSSIYFALCSICFACSIRGYVQLMYSGCQVRHTTLSQRWIDVDVTTCWLDVDSVLTQR